MSDKHRAEVLADQATNIADEWAFIHTMSWTHIRDVLQGCAAELRRISALEAALEAAKDYIVLLEYSADGYYNVEATDEAEAYKTALVSARKDTHE